MRWSSVLRLYPRRLRARLGQELFAFAGIAVGVALLFAVQVSNASLNSTIAQTTRGLVGRAQLQLRARDATGLPERLVARIDRSPGVAATAPVLEAPANLVGPLGQRPVTLLGADRRVGRLGGTLPDVATSMLPHLHAAILPEAVGRAIGAQPGAIARLQIGGHTLALPVAAVFGHGVIGALADAPVVLAPLGLAQALAEAPGRVSRVFVVARPGRERTVRALLERLAGDRFDVRAADDDVKVFAQASVPNDQSTSLFSQVTAFVGFLFALNAMLLMAGERRRMIAAMRISGHSVKTVRRMLLLDALLLGVLASLAGLALGDQLSRHVFPPAPGYLTLAFPIGTARVVPWQTIAVALAGGIVAALLGTLAPLLAGRRASPIGEDGFDPGAARRLLTPRWRMLVAGAVALAGCVAIFALAPAAAKLGVALLTGSMLLCLPAILALTLTLAQRLSGTVRSPVARLAIGELRSNGSRSAVLAGIAAVAVFASGAIEGAHRDLQAGLDSAVHAVSADADVWVTPASAANQLDVAPFRPDVRQTIARLPHVARVDVVRGALLTIGERRVWILAPPRAAHQLVPASQILHGDPSRANALVRGGQGAAVSDALAKDLHLRLGRRFTLDAPRPASLRVAAIITNYGWSPGALVVSADTFRRAWGTTDATGLEVHFAGGTTPAQGRAIVAHALAGGPWSGLAVETATHRAGQQRHSARAGLARLTQLARLVLLTAALAIAIAIGAMILQRRPGLATLKLSGIGRAHLYQALLLETALVLAVGCATGGTYALFGVQLFDRWLTGLTGYPIERSLGIAAALASLAPVALVAIAVTAVPGFLAANVRVDAAFQE